MGNCFFLMSSNNKRKLKEDLETDSNSNAKKRDESESNAQKDKKSRNVTKEISPTACFGAGCYWGTEHYIKNKFTKFCPNSISSGQVGFMGPEGSKVNPSYKEVCSGSTGHVEVYQCNFIGGEETFKKLVRYFFSFHDPTMGDRQRNDKGTQYASVIYCADDIQFEIASKVKEDLQNILDRKLIKAFEGSKITTDIRMSTMFYPAHEEHQAYLLKNPKGYCNHKILFNYEIWPDVETYEKIKKEKKEKNVQNEK